MSVCLVFALLFVFESGICVFVGYSANSKNNFKIITSVQDEKQSHMQYFMRHLVLTLLLNVN